MKTHLFVLMILFAGLSIIGCDKGDLEHDGTGKEEQQGGDFGNYDPEKEDPMEELLPLEAVEDVCTKMDDLNFMAYCYENFDVNGDAKVSMSEASAVTVIECNSASSFSGIEYFSGLETFKSSSVTSVEFGYNVNLSSVDCSGSSLTTVDLRYNSLLADITFSYCRDLVKILLADDAPLESIEYDDFNGCTILQTISLPDDCGVIGNAAFAGLSSLTQIKLPENLTTIGSGAFYNCSGLTDIVLPEGLTAIGSGAFEGCSGLTDIVLPEGLTAIGNEVFCACSSLTDIVLPKGLTAIGSGAFYNCSSLTDIVLPEGLTAIGYTAFEDCDYLATIDASKCGKLNYIGGSAFSKSPIREFLLGAASVISFEEGEFPFDRRYYDNLNTLKVPAEAVDDYKSSVWTEYFGTIVPLD